MNRFSFELPFFPGFYESSLETSDTSYYAIKEELEYYYHEELAQENPEFLNLTENDLDFNYKEYEKDVMEGFINAFHKHTPEIVENVEFDELVSPRYYNFSTDRLFAWITFGENWKEVFKEFMDTNKEWLTDHILEAWSSCDGFISFIENDFNLWYGKVLEEEDPQYIGIMLGYMMRFENGYDDFYNLSDSIIMDTLEDVYAGCYVYITDEGKKKLKELTENNNSIIPDHMQLEIPFE